MAENVEYNRFKSRLGHGKNFVFASSASQDLGEQAEALFQTVSTTLVELGGWLLLELYSTTPEGFANLMVRRATDLPFWEEVCPSAPEADVRVRTLTEWKVPATMAVRQRYPCWLLDGRAYTIDLFNPRNELGLPYELGDVRFWTLVPDRPSVKMAGSAFLELIKRISERLEVQLAFGGPDLERVLASYRFAEFYDDVAPLDASVRVSDLTYSFMVLPYDTVGSETLETLQREAFHFRNHDWRMGLAEEFGDEDRKYIVTATDAWYPEHNDILGSWLADLTGRPYSWKVTSEDWRGLP